MDTQEQNKKEDNLYVEQTNTIIIGKKGSSKTTLAWAFADKIRRLSGRKLCVFNYPQPELLKLLPFDVQNITRLEQLYTLTDCCVIVDEAQETFNVIDKKVNEDLKILLARSRQNNTCFIFICHNSYFLNRCLFSFIDVKIIKEVNDRHWELERLYMKKLYEDVHIFGRDNFFIDCDWTKGYKSFEKPTWWKEELSFAYRSSQSKSNFFT